MKRNLLLAVAFLATFTAGAQNIAVVSPSNVTTIYQTLDEAVSGADNGCIVYLPGGGFRIKEETLIDKKLTIMGVSHRGDTDNADGATVIGGNLNFVKGASGSAVVGVYLSGDINVGTASDSVVNLTVRYCNINSIQVKHPQSSGMVVNQSYLRNNSNFKGCNARLENNIIHSICDVNGGFISNNVIVNYGSYRRGQYGFSGSYDIYSCVIIAYNTMISNNILFSTGRLLQGSGCQVSDNMVKSENWGDNAVVLGGADWNAVFEKYNGGAISPVSKFHLVGDYKQYDNKIGIYGGTGFKDDTSLAPIPRIVSKKVAEQTDGTGKLKIEVTVKAQ